MAENVTASLVVSFDTRGSDTSTMSVEVDSRENGLNNGDTQFDPGDQVWCLLYKTDDVTVTGFYTSTGSMVAKGYEDIVVEEFVAFPMDREATLSKPAIGPVSYLWVGNNLGNITVENQTKLTAATEGVGVAKVNYTTRGYKYLYSSPSTVAGLTVFDVLLFWAGVANA